MQAADLACAQEADEVIRALLTQGYDYAHKRAEIAELFDMQLYNGNWDATTFFDDGTPELRFIQEDEYDQHMVEQPEYLVFAAGHYVIVEE